MKKAGKYLLMLAAVILLSAVGCMKVQAGDITLKNGKWQKGTLTRNRTDQYYKINIKKTGYMKVSRTRDDKDAFELDIKICDGKKKVIAEPSMFLSDFGFAVKKGTYYLLVSDYADGGDAWEDGLISDEEVKENYKIKYTFTAVKEGRKPTKPGKGLNKAPLLKKNQQVSGLIFQKKTEQRVYFKYVASAKTKVKFSYEVFGTTLHIADAKGSFLAFDDKGNMIKNKNRVVWWEGKNKDFVILPQGTYYFVIQPDAFSQSGYYKFKLL